ncbi:hypothetical protein LCGC14_0867530 [marine sediment metagenome]|uniref:Uncharacterized protein n=1 Tax=marine sediment metagenome TaxID=412755 RepID=A0A0F9P5J0_9ZZZZ|nr:hypothetical protein [Desulfobacterales bacterium]
MPTDLGQKFSLNWRGDPPHMLEPDIPVWYRFLEVYGNLFANLWYDVCVGGPFYTKKELEDPLKKMWYQNLAKRIDALAELSDVIWLIEVSADPGLRSIGQLSSYQILWNRDPKIMKPERLVLVAGTMEKDILDVAGTLSILCHII